MDSLNTRLGTAIRRLTRLLGLVMCLGSTAFGQSTATNHMDRAESKTIVIMGDSLAAGMGVDSQEAFPALLQKKIDAAGLQDVVVNAGVSGNTSADGVGQIDWLLRRKVDVFILELGGNDGLRGIPISKIQANLQTILDRVKVKYPQAKVVVAGMEMPVNMGEAYRVAFRKLFSDLAAHNHAELVPFLLEGVGGKPEFMQADRIHPNAVGHRIVADTVWKTLEPMLKLNQDSTMSSSRSPGTGK